MKRGFAPLAILTGGDAALSEVERAPSCPKYMGEHRGALQL